MPVEGPLPQTGNQQDIGADAERCFRARMPRNWRPHSLDGDDDYGLDYQVQTTPGQRATDIFRVQLKGTTSPDLSSNGEFISIQLKASTVRFYDRIVEPVLLVICDLSVNADPIDCPLYYAWVRDELRRIKVSTLDPAQKYVTFRAPTSNRLNYATDLSSDIDAQNELARAGQAMFLGIEQTHPRMRIEERVGAVKQITSGITARSAAFIDALASPAEHHWIDPALNSLAWHLKEAERLLGSHNLNRAEIELDAAEVMLPDAAALEIGDYWFLRGKWHSATGSDDQASTSFQQAHASNPLGKYWAAHVEAQFRICVSDEGPKSYPDIIAQLTGDDPAVISLKSRVLAAEGKLSNAIEVADQIDGPERYMARALAHTIFSKSANALQDCDLGLGTPDLPKNIRRVLLLLRARAKFLLAQASAPTWIEERLPPSGVAGIDPLLVREAWTAIQEAVDALREIGWSSNIDQIADIWCATASMLGKQEEVLPELKAAARLWPRLQTLQDALGSIAAQCGDFTTALEANKRLAPSDTRELQRVLLLHEANKHKECFGWFDSHFDSFDRNNTLFGLAATVASISAYKLSEPNLVKKWSAELDAHSHLKKHAVLLRYYLSIELNRIDNEKALDRLLEDFDELGRPFTIALALLGELDPANEKQAALCVQIAESVCEQVEPSPDMAAHVGLAKITVKDWPGLLEWCKKFKTRIDAGPRMLAFEALALDKLGHTQKAKELLENMLAGGVLDSLALNTYVTITVRCGYVQEAIDAAEKIMEAATSKRQQMDCIRLLFNLIQQSDHGSQRLLALAVQMGRLADQDSEIEESSYLIMFLMATPREDQVPTQPELAEFRQRCDAFFVKFPESKILKRGVFRENSSGSELIEQIKGFIGVSEDREAFQRRIENQLQLGLAVVPFSWRPNLVLSYIHDTVHLWEIAKTSSIDDKKYHLTMLNDAEWTPPSAASVSDRTPLLDLTALLVLFDLALIDTAIRFFGSIAIAKATLERLASLVSPFSGSPSRSKCVALQDALKPHFGSIIQPSVSKLAEEDSDENRVFGRELREITQLCQQDDSYRLYSDDLFFRIFVAQGSKPDGICTLDALAGFEQAGLLTRQDAARKISMLCRWHVGLLVQFDDLVALLPLELSEVSTVRQGIELLDQHSDFTAVIDAIWDFRAPFNKTLDHAAAVLRRLIEETTLSNSALASLIGLWFVKAGLKSDAPQNPLRILTKAITRAALSPNLTEAASSKLWNVYAQLVEFHHGALMDVRKEREAVGLLGAECAKLQTTDAELGQTIQSALRLGLTEGTSTDADFMAGFSTALVRIGTQTNQARR